MQQKVAHNCLHMPSDTLWKASQYHGCCIKWSARCQCFLVCSSCSHASQIRQCCHFVMNPYQKCIKARNPSQPFRHFSADMCDKLQHSFKQSSPLYPLSLTEKAAKLMQEGQMTYCIASNNRPIS